MTHPNPFAQNVPAEPAAPAQNPFAQPQQASPPAAYVQPAQQPATAPNPFAQPAAPAYAPHPAPQGPYGQTAPATPNYGAAPYGSSVPATQQQSAPPALGTATAPPPPAPGGGRGAKLPDMYGRLVIVFPHAVQQVPKNASFVTDADRASGNLMQDRMTATVIVLDAGAVGNMAPLAYGGNPHVIGGRPHTDSAPLPYVRKGMWLNQSQLIQQTSEYLPGRARGGPNGAPGAAVGRLVKTAPEQNAPWYLTTPTDEELALANAYLNLVMQGQYPHPLAP